MTIRTGNTEPIRVYTVDGDSVPLTGLTDLYVRIERESDGFFFDWNDLTFKSTGWTTLNKLLTEIDATNLAGVYEVTGGFDTSTVTNLTSDDRYTVYAIQTPGTTARLPSPASFDVGLWVDQINAILTDTAAIQPLVDVAVSTREAESAASSRAATNQSEHDTTQAAITALNDPTAAAIADAVWDEVLSGHVGAGSAGQTLARVDVDVSTRAAPGAAMDLVADAVDAASLATSAVDEIVDQVWEEALADHSGTVGSTAEALNDASSAASLSLGAIADAVWDEDMSAHNGAGTAGEYQRNADVDVSSRAVAGDAMDLIAGSVDANALAPTAVAEIADGVWDEALAGHTTSGSTGQAQNRLDDDISSRAAPGDAMDLVTGAVDSDAMATSGVAEIADGVWDEPLAGHVGAGSAGEAQNRLDDDVTSRAVAGDQMTLTVIAQNGLVDAVWDEALAGHLGVGSTGKALDDAGATADPNVIADAVWDEGAAGHTGAGSMGQLQNRLDANISTRAAPGDPMDLQANALDATSLDATAVAEIADGVWDEALAGHVGAGSSGEAQNRLDADISTRAAPGDAMDLITDAVDSNALATGAVDDIADQVWEETLADHSGTVGSTAEALDSVTAPAAPAVVAAAVWDEALAGHTTAGTAGEAQNRLDDIETDTSAIDARLPTAPADESSQLAQHGVTQAAIAALNDPTAADVRDAILADSTPFNGADIAAILVDTAALDARLPTDPADESTQLAQHVATQADIAALSIPTTAQIADGVWDEAIAGHLGAGSTGEALDAASGVANPEAIADAVWDEALSGHVTPGTAGVAQTEAAAAGAEASKIDSAATTWPPAVGSLLDRLANADAGQTYDQGTDSLEGLRNKIGGLP